MCYHIKLSYKVISQPLKNTYMTSQTHFWIIFSSLDIFQSTQYCWERKLLAWPAECVAFSDTLFGYIGQLRKRWQGPLKPWLRFPPLSLDMSPLDSFFRTYSRNPSMPTIPRLSRSWKTSSSGCSFTFLHKYPTGLLRIPGMSVCQRWLCARPLAHGNSTENTCNLHGDHILHTDRILRLCRRRITLHASVIAYPVTRTWGLG